MGLLKVMALFNESESVEPFKEKANALSNAFARIATLTARKELNFESKVPFKHINGAGLPYCRSSKPCLEKLVRSNKRKSIRRYHVCFFDGLCNQQTNERLDALVSGVYI